MKTQPWGILCVIVIAVAETPAAADFVAGDAVWNYRSNGDDRFHDNDSLVRPWQSGAPIPPWPTATEDSKGRWVGNHSYDFAWGNVDRMSWSFGQDGSFSLTASQDRQWHAWTYVYVELPRMLTVSGGGNCVPRFYLDGAFDSPQNFPVAEFLTSGWHRIDYTGYNQNSGYTCSFGALDVDAMDSHAVPTCTSFVAPDFDHDCDVDIDDINALIACARGATIPPIPSCESRDLDNDHDVDMTDFGIIQRCYNGPNNPVDPICATNAPAHISLEAEDGANPPQIMLRSAASGERTVLLLAGQSLAIPFILSEPGGYAFSSPTSNDNYGPLETVSVTLDDQFLGEFLPPDTGDFGFGWNVFASNDIGLAHVTADSHQLVFSVSGGDGYGVELDVVQLDLVGQ